MQKEKQLLGEEVQALQDSVAELQVQCQHHLEDKRQLKAHLSESQRNLIEKEQHCEELDKNLKEEKRLRKEEVSRRAI